MINIITFILALPFVYLFGYIAAAIIYAQIDFVNARQEFEYNTGKAAPDYRVYSWLFVWWCRKWLWREFTHIIKRQFKH